jgi:hypothetical protein
MTRLGSLVVLADHDAAYGRDWWGRCRLPWSVHSPRTDYRCRAGDVGGSDGELIVHAGCVAGFAGNDCGTQSWRYLRCGWR